MEPIKVLTLLNNCSNKLCEITKLLSCKEFVHEILKCSDVGTQLTETIIFLWTLSIVFIFNEIRRFGSRLYFRLQVKLEQSPYLVDSLETATLTHRAL